MSSDGNESKAAATWSSNEVGKVDLQQASTIHMTDITWLWQGWIALNKLHLLAGDAGTGKTTLALAIAAVVSRGGTWPDGSLAPVGNVLVWSGEDDVGDTIAPRLRAAGADMEKIFVVGEVHVGHASRPFDPATDLQLLVEEAGRVGGIALLVVDPVVSVIAGDGHKNTEVRRSLQPLVDLATHLGCGVLGISHFSKGSSASDPLQRVTGSVAFGAVARVVLVAAKKGGSDMRVIARAKSNIGPDEGGFAYQIAVSEGDFPASYVTWGEALEGTAKALLTDFDAVEIENNALKAAEKWLRAFLAHGPHFATDVMRGSQAAGISWRTVERAKESVGVKSVRAPKGGRRQWSLQPSSPPTPPSE